MPFYKWLQSMPFDFWLGFTLSVIPFFIAIYQLYKGRERAAAKFFLFTTICIMAVLVWTFFGKESNIRTPPEVRRWDNLLEDEPWSNAWPSMMSDPDGVPTQNNSGRFNALVMSVNGIVFTPEHTILHLTVRNGSSQPANLQAASGAYITDDQEMRYDYQKEGRRGQSGDPFLSNGEVGPNVTERFELSFLRLKPTGSIILNHPQFLPIKIYQHTPTPAIVNFCRPHQGTGYSDRLKISCDGKHVADFAGGLTNLSNGHSTSISLKPGKHTCQVTSDPLLGIGAQNVSMDLDITSGKEYYIQAEFNWVTGKLIVKSVSNEAECMKAE